MTFPNSPGVYFREFSVGQVAGPVSTSQAAIAGIFGWGPLFTPTLVASEAQMVQLFGKPTNLNAETWFSGANFFEYGNALWISRTANTTSNTSNSALNAVANTGAIANILNDVVLNYGTFSTQVFEDTNVQYIAKWPGAKGNSLRISQCDSPNAFSSNVNLSGTIVSGNAAGNSYTGQFSVNIGANTASIVFTPSVGSNVAASASFATAIVQDFSVGDNIKIGNSQVGFQYLYVSGISNVTTNSTTSLVTLNLLTASRLAFQYTSNTVQRFWEFWNQVGVAPGETPSVLQATSNSQVVDQMHVVVVDNNGLFSGIPGQVLETYKNLSFATDAVAQDGSSTYYRTVINQQSPYIWAVNDRPGVVSNTSVGVVNSTNQNNLSLNFIQGQDGDSEAVAPLSTLALGWLPFLDKTIPISLVICGKSVGGQTSVNGYTYNNFQSPQWIEQNIVQPRRDCVGFFSPDKGIVVNNTGGEGIPVDIFNWSTLINPSTYMVIDSGYKWQYDRYNNINRWIPLNGDIAGTCAYTDQVSWPWFAPAGVNRGLISNVIKLAYNPSETDRDYLYPLGINPVISEPGYGTYLFGQRTFTEQDIPFNRINIRRLFIYLEQSLVKACKPLVFEINDVFTQNQFINIVTPLLKEVQGARGITKFTVVCDGTNNTPQVVANEQFKGAIYITPAYVAEELMIDFIAVEPGVSFTTVENPSF